MDGPNVNVDDLFNEDDLGHAALNLPLAGNDVADTAAHYISLECRIRLDELHTNGCRQRISWSRLGCVATISSDSSSVGIRCLRLRRQTATWELSSIYNLEFAAEEPPHSWTHLCWSSTGIDLAIFDNTGKVFVFAMSTASAVNRFQDLSFPNPDHGDELKQAVGTFWLPAADRESPAVPQMSKQGEQWAHVITKRKPIGPVWSRALLFVTRMGILRLLYIKLDRTWSETDALLSSPSKSQDLLTHAAFAPTVDGSILITTHSASGKFSVYSVQVVRPQLLPDQMVTTPITLAVEHIKSNIYNPPPSNTIASGDLMGSRSSHDKLTCLSHLEIVPTTDIEKAVQIPPTIFAVNTIFSSIPGIHNFRQARSSTIQRWSLHTVSETLHPRFDEVPTKGTNTTNYSTPKTLKTMERLPSISFDGIITSVHLVDSSTALAITTADGTTTLYNPSTMSPIFYESSPNEVTSLSQAGFAFAPTPHPFSHSLAFSPNACCLITLSPTSSELILTSIAHPTPLSPSSSTTTLLELIPPLAALTLSYTRSCYSNSSTDDLLYTILHTVHPTHHPSLSSLLLSTLFRPGEFIRQGAPGSDLDKLAQKMLVPRCLSLFAALGVSALPESENRNGHKKTSIHRSLPARYAWLTLQIRHVAMQLLFIVNSAKARERLPGEIVGMTGRAIGWAMGLVRWIVDELCAVEDGEEEGDRELVALVLTGVWSRYFLRMVEKVSRMLRGQGEVGRGVRKEEGKGVTLNGLGGLLEGVERGERELGVEGERRIIAEGKGDGVEGLLESLVREVLPGLRKSGEVDKLKIYTSGMEKGLEWTLLEEGDVDVHRKRVVGKGKGEVRRCVRCASVSEDVAGAKREWPKWIQQQMSRCVCEGSFWVEGFDD